MSEEEDFNRASILCIPGMVISTMFAAFTNPFCEYESVQSATIGRWICAIVEFVINLLTAGVIPVA